MKLTDDQKVQIFCAALNGIVQADATGAAAAGPHQGSGQTMTPVKRASLMTVEAMVTLQGPDWK